MLPKCLRLLLVLLLPLAVAVQAEDSRYYTDSVSGIRLPKSSGFLQLSGEKRYEDPRLGLALRYTGKQRPAYADIYLYPIPDWKPDGGDQARAKALQVNFKSTMNDVFTARKYGYYESVKLESKGEFAVEHGKQQIKGYKAVFTIKNRGRLMKSYLYLFAFDNTLFKVRYSHLKSASEITESVVDAFIRNLLTPAAKQPSAAQSS